MSQGGAAANSLESQRKAGLGGRFRGLAWNDLPLPDAPLVASLTGTLRVRERKVKVPPCEGRKAWACS